MPGWNHEGKFKKKPCAECAKEFQPKSGAHKFCSERCKGKHKYTSGVSTTTTQYRRISGNWARYFSRLCSSPSRRGTINRAQLLSMLEKQKGRCALSGVQLTCELEVGNRTPTNASVDRINAGGLYVPGNIQLVCVAVNRIRSDLTVDDFVMWCDLVSEYRGKHGKKAQLP